MKWWNHVSPMVRKLMALAMLAAFMDAAALHAAQYDECEAVDSDGMPRDCTFSERLGQCGWAAWDSWKQCVDPDGDGLQDVNGWEAAYCDFWAAVDLLACGVWVPWDIIIGQ